MKKILMGKIYIQGKTFMYVDIYSTQIFLSYMDIYVLVGRPGLIRL